LMMEFIIYQILELGLLLMAGLSIVGYAVYRYSERIDYGQAHQAVEQLKSLIHQTKEQHHADQHPGSRPVL
jgi:hypothetical protein